MPRPTCCKHVERLPEVRTFKPQGIPLRHLESVVLLVDELEALRLCHREGLYQEEAAVRMGVSRQTLGRILESAHRKVTQALCEGSALRIEGGSFHLQGNHCPRCVPHNHPERP